MEYKNIIDIRTKRVGVVIGVVLCLFGTIFSISGLITNSLTLTVISLISAILGVILIAYMGE